MADPTTPTEIATANSTTPPGGPPDSVLLDGLAGLRLPAEAPLPDVAAAFALGLALVALAGALLGLFARTPPRLRDRALARLADLGELPPGERMLALAHLLREVTDQVAPEADGRNWLDRAQRCFDLPPEAVAGLGIALYQPGVEPDPAPLEQALRQAFASLRV
ncbi:MAG: hypothetical protein AAGF44_05090 [Pseudomonadota bacterium]